MKKALSAKKIAATGRLVVMEIEYPPLSGQSVAELRAKADTYRQMAETARTADTKNGLLKLAAPALSLAPWRSARRRVRRP
jgi:hypothetical protein